MAEPRITSTDADTIDLKTGLVTLTQIARFHKDDPVLTLLADWVTSYLSRPHPELGRRGVVCPFTPGAVMRNRLRIAVRQFEGTDRLKQVLDAVMYFRSIFLAEDDRSEDRIYDTILIAFPEVSLSEAATLIDATKEELKPDFACKGLMLGEFHDRNPGTGLHNPHFRPLRSPVPMLVIRHMVPSDLPFLTRPEDLPGRRIEYLKAYLQVLPDLTSEEREAGEKHLEAARKEEGAARL